jgi:hypothetical protein
LAAHTAVAASFVLAGTVSDASTGVSVSGAEVTLHSGGADVGTTVTAGDGLFQLPFDMTSSPQPKNLKLIVRREGFVAMASDVVVSAAGASPRSFAFALVPSAISNCVRAADHAIVVGFFRPAGGSPGDADISGRVADALNYDLLVHLQQSMSQQTLPSVIPCGNAKPIQVTDSPKLVNVLHADALVTGSVNAVALQKVKVDITVFDRFELPPFPKRTSSKDVNLDDPELARLDRSAQEAILTALISGYEREGHFAECVDFTSAAARIVGALSGELASARQRCEQKAPNHGLLPGGQP